MKSRRPWLVGGFAAVALVVVVAGCLLVVNGTVKPGGPDLATGVAQASSTLPPTAHPSPTSSPSPSPTPSHTPSLTPAASAGYTEGPSGIAYVSSDGTTVTVPQIPGLSSSLADGKVTYTALAGNRYGLKRGTAAGWFKPDVTVSGVQTGGVVLDGRAVAVLMNDKLKAISDPDKRIAIPSPVVPDGPLNVSFYKESFPATGLTNVPAISFKYAGTARVANIVPNNGGIDCSTYSDFPLWDCLDIGGFAGKAAPAMNTLVYFGQGSSSPTAQLCGLKPDCTTQSDFNWTTKTNYPIGGALVEVPDEVDLTDGTTAPIQKSYQLGPDSLLTARDALVLVEAA